MGGGAHASVFKQVLQSKEEGRAVTLEMCQKKRLGKMGPKGQQETRRVRGTWPIVAGSEDGQQGLWVASRGQEWPPSGHSQQGNWDLSPTATRNWFLSTTWINLQVDPPSEFTESNTGLPALDFAPVKPRRIQAGPNLQPKMVKTFKLCCLHL